MRADEWVVCLGWDVGGWMGRKHGAAAVAWQLSTRSVQWLGSPSQFRLPGPFLPFLDFVTQAVGGGDLGLLEDARLIVGIDAPLGYPSAYRRLVAGEAVVPNRFEREIDNVFAYRRTERHVQEELGKKPLSAPFDKLGNNASVAISHARQWSAENGLTVVPFRDASASDGVIIEVYPALSKTKDGVAVPALSQWMPNGVKVGTDAYDAAICALTALAFAAGGKVDGLPEVCELDQDYPEIAEEGWIYYMLS